MSSPDLQPISFARGAPSVDIVDIDGLRAAATQALSNDPAGTTAYGTAVGYQPLRKWVAKQHNVTPEHVLLTNGSMQADAFLFQLLVNNGDGVIVERPTYDRTLLSLQKRGAQISAIELEADGISLAALEQELNSNANIKLAHVIPNFQNPAGVTLSQAKREQLLALAKQHNFIIFEDDPYVELRFQGERLPTMLSLDTNNEHVIYASSFSKTVCPGVRVGYLIGNPEIIEKVRKLATETYISPNIFAQAVVYQFCVSGAYQKSIETVKHALRERAELLGKVLDRELPQATHTTPEGGYFMWVELPTGTDVDQLQSKAAALGVSFVAGTDFVLTGGANTLRLAYSGVTFNEILEAIR